LRFARLSAATLCPLFAAGAQALEPDKVFEKVSPSVWAVRALDATERPVSQGSAVVVGPGRLITTCSVLRQGRSIQIRQDNMMYAATLEFPDTERDLCQLSVRNFNAPAVSIAPAGSLKVGQRAFAIGSPRGLELSMSDGILSSLRAGDDTAPLIQTSATISPGTIGGGLFDTEGRLIGITTSKRRDGQALNFAIPAEWVTEVPVRGQTALDRRRETALVAATAAPPPSEFPKQITGEAFSKFFQTNRSLNGVSIGGRPLRFQLYGSYVDGTTEANSMSAAMAAGITRGARGRLETRPGNSQICFNFNTSPNDFWLAQTGCYRLMQMAATQYVLQSDNGGADFTFTVR
jgi:hypothetical protein